MSGILLPLPTAVNVTADPAAAPSNATAETMPAPPAGDEAAANGGESFDASCLRPDIEALLRDPRTDLETVSAKRIRKLLIEMKPEVDIKSHKAAVDDQIITIFYAVRAEREAARGATDDLLSNIAPPTSTKRQRSISPSHNGAPSSSQTPLKQKPNVAVSKALTDEEMARKLHAEMNSRSSRTRGAASAGSGSGVNKSGGSAAGGKRKKVKSKEIIEDDEEDGGGDGTDDQPAKKKRKTGGGGGGGYNAPLRLSQELAEVVGGTEMSRPQVVKQLWVYIKANNLQDPNSKKDILCDARFERIFKRPMVGMFQMNKLLGAHLYPIEKEA